MTMKPVGRLVLEFPVYGMTWLGGGAVVCVGGGGRMKSGIGSGIQVHSFHERAGSFKKLQGIETADAPIAVAGNSCSPLIYTLVGPGCKNYAFDGRRLQPESGFEHDIRIAKKQEQSCIALSADASVLLVASDAGSVQALSLPECAPMARFDLHTKGVNYIDVTAEGRHAVSISRDHSAYIWDTTTAQILQKLEVVAPPELKTHICAARFSPSDPAVLFTAESNPRQGAWISVWRACSSPLSTTAPSPGENSRVFHRYKIVTSGKVLRDSLTSMAVHENGRVAVSSSEGHVALLRWNGVTRIRKVWSTETRERWFKDPPPPHVLPVTSVAFSARGKYFLTASADFTVAAWPARGLIRIRSVMSAVCWIGALLAVLLALLLAEEPELERISKDVALHRRRLEPHISDAREYLRPKVAKRAERLRAIAENARDVAGPLVHAQIDRVRPLFHGALTRSQPLLELYQYEYARLKHAAHYTHADLAQRVSSITRYVNWQFVAARKALFPQVSPEFPQPPESQHLVNNKDSLDRVSFKSKGPVPSAVILAQSPSTMHWTCTQCSQLSEPGQCVLEIDKFQEDPDRVLDSPRSHEPLSTDGTPPVTALQDSEALERILPTPSPRTLTQALHATESQHAKDVQKLGNFLGDGGRGLDSSHSQTSQSGEVTVTETILPAISVIEAPKPELPSETNSLDGRASDPLPVNGEQESGSFHGDLNGISDSSSPKPSERRAVTVLETRALETVVPEESMRESPPIIYGQSSHASQPRHAEVVQESTDGFAETSRIQANAPASIDITVPETNVLETGISAAVAAPPSSAYIHDVRSSESGHLEGTPEADENLADLDRIPEGSQSPKPLMSREGMAPETVAPEVVDPDEAAPEPLSSANAQGKHASESWRADGAEDAEDADTFDDGREQILDTSISRGLLSSKAMLPETVLVETISEEMVAQETVAPGKAGPESVGQEIVDQESVGQETVFQETVTAAKVAHETVAPGKVTHANVAQEAVAAGKVAQETVAQGKVAQVAIEAAVPTVVVPASAKGLGSSESPRGVVHNLGKLHEGAEPIQDSSNPKSLPPEGTNRLKTNAPELTAHDVDLLQSSAPETLTKSSKDLKTGPVEVMDVDDDISRSALSSQTPRLRITERAHGWCARPPANPGGELCPLVVFEVEDPCEISADRLPRSDETIREGCPRESWLTLHRPRRPIMSANQ
jgi:hypothetical protein